MSDEPHTPANLYACQSSRWSTSVRGRDSSSTPVNVPSGQWYPRGQMTCYLRHVLARCHQNYDLKIGLLSTANADISDWEAEFQELVGEEASKSGVFNIKYLTARSISDALNESLSGELFLFVITCKWSSPKWSSPVRGTAEVSNGFLLKGYLMQPFG